MDIYEGGVEVGEDVSLMWCEEKYGYIRDLGSGEEGGGGGGNGI